MDGILGESVPGTEPEPGTGDPDARSVPRTWTIDVCRSCSRLAYEPFCGHRDDDPGWSGPVTVYERLEGRTVPRLEWVDESCGDGDKITEQPDQPEPEVPASGMTWELYKIIDRALSKLGNTYDIELKDVRGELITNITAWRDHEIEVYHRTLKGSQADD
jgi:hypothetical protein